ncbi:MAG TPA: vanadium-dependent haloperoxidase [Bryobacteraceae bacterium]|nr:vanadium-dependent haloperoxidase [Bryobacteraceae bacterium]
MSTLKNYFNVVALSVLLLASCRVGQADEVTDWNQIMLEATLVPPATPAPVSTRTTAIVQAAVFDAVNGIDPQYTPIHVFRRAPRKASKRAAAVQAAYATLIRLYPAQSDMLDQQRSASLAAIARGWEAERPESIQKGIEWGQTVADSIWAWRSNDGFSQTPPPFMGGTAPGEWRPTPPAFLPGLTPQLAHVTPWVLQSPSQFRPAGPPALDSAEYTVVFDEIKAMGSISSTSRTPDETAAALFWNPGNPPDFWDPVGVALSQKQHFGLLRTAHLLAQMNLAMADAMIGCWDAKYTYVSWRPVTAIPLADTDGNPDTAPDPNWTPLLVTPPFPGYPSAHSCASGAAAWVLAHHFGDHTAITVANDALPGQTRSFGSFSAALAEVVDARVFGGIHFRTDCDAGQALGESVADYVIKHSLRPLDRWDRRDERVGDWGH